MMSPKHTNRYIIFDFNGVLDVEEYHPSLLNVLQTLAPTARLEILSRTGVQMIERYLKEHGLSYFSNITSTNSSQEKAEYLNACQAAGNDVWFVTDTVGDINAARGYHIPTIGAAWGFDSGVALSEAGARGVVSSPEEILQYF